MNRRSMLTTAGLVGAASLLGSGTAGAKAAELARMKRGRPEVQVKTRQRRDQSVHWIQPGPRRLDPRVFGTPPSGPSSPQLSDDWIAHQVWWLSQARPAAAKLLTGGGTHPPFPVPVGWPEALRGTTAGGDAYTRTKMPLPFSDNTVGSDENEALDGALRLTYRDRRGFEGDGRREDEIDLDVWFTDPDGNRYDVEIEHLEHHDGAHLHGRGVMTGVYMHGTTGIGTPLMPTQYAFGSFWAIGSVRINGNAPRAQNTERVVHMMTTQTVRKADGYTLAFDADLPLGVDGNPDPYRGEETHTHLFLPPVRETADGPRRVPLETAYELPNGKTQPFVHFMFDEDDVQFD